MAEPRFVIDTNVLISAAVFYPSLGGRAFREANRIGYILQSIDTLHELEDVLRRPKFDRFVSLDTRLRFLEALLHKVQLVPITERVTVCREPKDDQFLELAINGQADAILTGDDDLLVLHPFRGIPIVNAPSFLEQSWTS